MMWNRLFGSSNKIIMANIYGFHHFPFIILHEFLSSWERNTFSTLLWPTFSLYRFWVLLFVSMLFPNTSNSDPKSFTQGTLSLASHCAVRQCFNRTGQHALTYCPTASNLALPSTCSAIQMEPEFLSAVTETSWNLLNFELLMGDTARVCKQSFFSPTLVYNLNLSPYLRVSPSVSLAGQIWNTFLREG